MDQREDLEVRMRRDGRPNPRLRAEGEIIVGQKNFPLF